MNLDFFAISDFIQIKFLHKIQTLHEFRNNVNLGFTFQTFCEFRTKHEFRIYMNLDLKVISDLCEF